MITKSKILLNLQCPKRLWLSLNRTNLVADALNLKSKMEEGNKVGELARTFYPQGYLVSAKTNQLAIDDTKIKIEEEKNKTLFEAAFVYEEVLIRADILIPEHNGYRLEEVKSSTQIKPYHIEDAAVQNWVLQNNGYEPTSVHITYINNKFKYIDKNNYNGLFISGDITEAVYGLIKKVPIWVNKAKDTVSSNKEPIRAVGKHCKKPFECPYFNHCNTKDPDIKYPLDILPNSSVLIKKFVDEGYKCLTSIPEERLSNEKHKRIWRVSKSGEPELDIQASKILNQLPYPWFFLDFETIAYAIPRWVGTRPYMQVPFQWSCHIKRTAKSSIENEEHKEFLDITGEDPREDFIINLIKAVENEGTIFVYNEAFEKTRIAELQRDFPQYAQELQNINSRIFDLLKIARNHYYHPNMMGSWSIKNVLPTVYDGATYGELEVKNGTMAQEEYRRAISIDTTTEEKIKIDRALKKYCHTDTLSMWRVADRFLELSSS